MIAAKFPFQPPAPKTVAETRWRMGNSKALATDRVGYGLELGSAYTVAYPRSRYPIYSDLWRVSGFSRRGCRPRLLPQAGSWVGSHRKGGVEVESKNTSHSAKSPAAACVEWVVSGKVGYFLNLKFPGGLFKRTKFTPRQTHASRRAYEGGDPLHLPPSHSTLRIASGTTVSAAWVCFLIPLTSPPIAPPFW